MPLPKIPGLIRGESNFDYHNSDAVSFSKLKVFEQRPSLYYKRFVTREIKQEETPAMAFGTMFHTRVLEGKNVYKERYERLPDAFDGRTNEGREIIARIVSEGRTPVKTDVWEEIEELAASVDDNPTAYQLLSFGEPELTWRLAGATHSIQCKTDWVCFDGCELTDGKPYIVDLKTTNSLDDWLSESYNSPLFRFGYPSQECFYRCVANKILADAGLPVIERFLFVCTEKNPPYESAVFEVNEETRMVAMSNIMDSLGRIAKCYETGVWPGMSTGILPIGLSPRVMDTRALDMLNSRRALTEGGK